MIFNGWGLNLPYISGILNLDDLAKRTLSECVLDDDWNLGFKKMCVQVFLFDIFQ